MFARVSVYQESPEGMDESIRNWEDVIARVNQGLEAEGIAGKGAMLLVERKSGKSMTISFWNSEEDMRSSAEVANKARSEATEASGGHIVSVEEFEVALDDRG